MQKSLERSNYLAESVTACKT